MGRGPGEGIIKSVLPDAHTDFIFAVMAEEFGLLGVTLLLLLYLVLVGRGLYIAAQAQDTFTRLLAGALSLSEDHLAWTLLRESHGRCADFPDGGRAGGQDRHGARGPT
mgnify:CR=1 FL=1